MVVSCINITIIDDNDVEGPHAFELSISSTTPSITVPSADSTVRVDVTDNDGKHASACYLIMMLQSPSSLPYISFFFFSLYRSPS